ncbi:VanZ family protein [Flavobacterium wongokense]|uniref:VanZ family protein n=1 Tax=Flavobacterium wongokense TaxID=2910674 RepID=UPI001F45D1B8|nr:VanZ family protein [Flavobacterium sp. WG47]MCF6131070.1 VanZ family protein [Flavobacterium sp. WG47]
MPTNNLLVLKKGLFSLAVGWTVVIAFLCLVKFNDLPSLGFTVSSLDKYVHITLHFVFTMLWGFYSRQKWNQIELKRIFIVVLFSIGYGILIEILQELVTTTRHADILDVLANFTGAMIAFLTFVLIKKLKKANHS